MTIDQNHPKKRTPKNHMTTTPRSRSSSAKKRARSTSPTKKTPARKRSLSKTTDPHAKGNDSYGSAENTAEQEKNFFFFFFIFFNNISFNIN
jgi:hypothetical protein